MRNNLHRRNKFVCLILDGGCMGKAGNAEEKTSDGCLELWLLDNSFGRIVHVEGKYRHIWVNVKLGGSGPRRVVDEFPEILRGRIWLWKECNNRTKAVLLYQSIWIFSLSHNATLSAFDLWPCKYIYRYGIESVWNQTHPGVIQKSLVDLESKRKSGRWVGEAGIWGKVLFIWRMSGQIWSEIKCTRNKPHRERFERIVLGAWSKLGLGCTYAASPASLWLVLHTILKLSNSLFSIGFASESPRFMM